MYREWMATMERRVNNLQVTNEDLQVCLSFKKTKKEIVKINLQTWLHDDNEISPNRRPGGGGSQRR